MSNSLRPHGLYPTSLLCPWDSPVKNTGAGCHSLLQGIFLNQEWNLGLLHCRQILYFLSLQRIICYNANFYYYGLKNEFPPPRSDRRYRNYIRKVQIVVSLTFVVFLLRVPQKYWISNSYKPYGLRSLSVKFIPLTQNRYILAQIL